MDLLDYLQNLPKEAEILSRTSLSVNDKNITSLTESIGKLSQLKSLDLSNTQISELPEFIGQLSHLFTLDLRDTQIKELPESVKQNNKSAFKLNIDPVTSSFCTND